MNLLDILAQTTGPTTGGTPPPDAFLFLRQFGPILLLIIVFYLFMFRSKSGERKKRENMLAALKKGDRVQTIGGIIATVLDVRDVDVVLKVDETSNTKMRFARSAIARVLTEEKSESK